MFILQLVFRPYKKTLDNVSICFNSGLLLIFLVFFLVRNRFMTQENSDFEIIFGLAFASLCVACIVLSFARVLRVLCCSVKQK